MVNYCCDSKFNRSLNEVCNFVKIHTPVSVRLLICFESHQQGLCVLLRSFGYAFFILKVYIMTNIELIRELHCYKKMYSTLQRTITKCIEESRDFTVREKLIKAQQEAEDIYTGEIYDSKDMTADERVIAELLSFIRDTEVSRVTNPDMQIVDDCVDWLLVMQNKKIELSEEYIKEQVNKIFSLKDRIEESEQ